MLSALLTGDPVRPPGSRAAAGSERPELNEWLRSGRLVLVDEHQDPVSPERWEHLPPEVRARALEDFSRVVRGGAKAAVIFLRP